jgi:hypothetical protein
MFQNNGLNFPQARKHLRNSTGNVGGVGAVEVSCFLEKCDRAGPLR